MIFFSNKRNGKLELEAPTRYQKYIDSLPECRISIQMKRYRKPRSLDQNNMWHGLCQVIADEVGYSLDEVKGGIKIEAGLYTKKGRMTLMISSASLDKLEMGKLINKTYQVAAEMNILLPTPEEWKAMQ